MDRPTEITPGLYQSGSPESVDADVDVIISLQLMPPHYLPPQPAPQELLSLWWPIDDGPMPDPATVRSLARFVADLLNQGRRVLVHCAAGNNRSGLVVARTLIEQGMGASTAIGMVRRAVPSALVNPHFESWLLSEQA